jgi:hypothetical protein
MWCRTKSGPPILPKRNRILPPLVVRTGLIAAPSFLCARRSSRTSRNWVALNLISERAHARRPHEQRPSRPKPHQLTGAGRSPVLGRQIQCIKGTALGGREERRAFRGRRGKRTEKISLGRRWSYAPAIFAEEPEAKAAKATKRALVGAMTQLFAANKIHIEHLPSSGVGYPIPEAPGHCRPSDPRGLRWFRGG